MCVEVFYAAVERDARTASTAAVTATAVNWPQLQLFFGISIMGAPCLGSFLVIGGTFYKWH